MRIRRFGLLISCVGMVSCAMVVTGGLLSVGLLVIHSICFGALMNMEIESHI